MAWISRSRYCNEIRGIYSSLQLNVAKVVDFRHWIFARAQDTILRHTDTPKNRLIILTAFISSGLLFVGGSARPAAAFDDACGQYAFLAVAIKRAALSLSSVLAFAPIFTV